MDFPITNEFGHYTTNEPFTNKDIQCNWCGGKLNNHLRGEHIIKWCDYCGANDKKRPPKVILNYIGGQAKR